MAQQLERKLAQQQDETKQHEEKVQEFEEYIRIQDDYFEEQISEIELHTADIREAHEKGNKYLHSVDADLTRIFTEFDAKYEKTWVELLVGEAKLMTLQGSADVHIAELCKELAATQYQVNMGEEKV